MLLSICLIFCQFKSGVAYKSVAYKKKRVCRLCSVHYILDCTMCTSYGNCLDRSCCRSYKMGAITASWYFLFFLEPWTHFSQETSQLSSQILREITCCEAVWRSVNKASGNFWGISLNSQKFIPPRISSVKKNLVVLIAVLYGEIFFLVTGY